MPHSLCRGLSLLALLFPLAARADYTIAPISVTATRIPTPVAKVAAGVTIITHQEIAARGYTTLAQALGAVPGLGVVQAGGPGGQTSVFIRGTNSEDVLVLLDGVPANDPSIANGGFNFGEDQLAGIERIEIIRGPLSGLYGSNAIGGVINLISLRGQGQPHAEISLAGGFPGQTKDSATVSGASGALDYAVSGAIDEEAGFDATARRLAVYAAHRDPFRSKSGLLNLGYTPAPGTRVYVTLRARDSDSAYPDLGFPVFDDPNEYSYDTNLFGKLGLTTQITDALSSEVFIARVVDDRRYSNLLDAADPNFATANDHYYGARTDAQANFLVRLPTLSLADASSLQFGTEYIDDSARESVNENGFIQSVNASQHAVSGHVSAQTTLAERLTLTAALRDDAVSSFGNAFTGRVGGVLAVPEADLHLKSSYGTGFLAPSLYDLHGVDNFGYRGNPNLKAEHASGYDAGAQFDIPALGQADFFSVLATYFHNDIHDLITSTPDFTSVENIGRARIDGVETEFLVRPADWIFADLTYTYTNARDAQAHTQLLRRPRNSGSATVTFQPLPQLRIVPELRYIGGFADFLYADSGFPTGTGDARPGTILDLTADYAVTPRFTLFLQGKNLAGSRFEPVNGLQTPGASVLLGVRAEIQ